MQIIAVMVKSDFFISNKDENHDYKCFSSLIPIDILCDIAIDCFH